MIGSECYETALEFVRRKAVSQQIWITSQNALFGIVNGRYGDRYTPTVYFSRQGPVPVVKAVRCNCSASYGCEHAAALVVAAASGGSVATGTAALGPAAAGTAARGPAALGAVFPASALSGTLPGPRRGDWDASLESWLTAGREARRTGTATLAIELTLEAGQSLRPPRLGVGVPGRRRPAPYQAGSLPRRPRIP